MLTEAQQEMIDFFPVAGQVSVEQLEQRFGSEYRTVLDSLVTGGYVELSVTRLRETTDRLGGPVGGDIVGYKLTDDGILARRDD
jgi:hypothetical protein